MENKRKTELITVIKRTIYSIEATLKKNIKQERYKQNIFEVMKDLALEFEEYGAIDKIECGKLAIKNYIPLINLLIKVETNLDRIYEYHQQLENAYKLAARVSLEHFIIYMEWYSEDKLLEPRFNILNSYVYYLNKMCFDQSFGGMIVNLPSGYGKSRICRYYEAFRLGLHPEGTFLALCSNDALIKGQSRSVIDLIKNERFGNVFPNLKYN